MSQSRTIRTRSVAETEAFGEGLAAKLTRGDCVALVGELGAGKTALVRGLARGLGVADTRLVSSPTYVLVREYPGKWPVYHVDLYRLSAPSAELAELGLDEMLADGVVLIEWADRAAEALPRGHWRIALRAVGRGRREISVADAGSGEAR